ncbi:ankyrin repeat domain-containing protein [Candidatus Dependentiae bacterium]|nr:ankyrin repeat domain-containing protein [Candidatus Dependentiae bacterium]MBU4387011.1 ankyrin repeat domain-containing protein [Candidatus Dependentiae bacterium]MCG2756092.1 ankyrin repeat domain-containing protein [Candidatus Dependentiae bacterium]
MIGYLNKPNRLFFVLNVLGFFLVFNTLSSMDNKFFLFGLERDFNNIVGIYKFGDLDKVKEHLENKIGLEKINIFLNEGKQTLLMIAASGGNYDVVKYLVENGADFKIKDIYGNAALQYAINCCPKKGYVEKKLAKFENYLFKYGDDYIETEIEKKRSDLQKEFEDQVSSYKEVIEFLLQRIHAQSDRDYLLNGDHWGLGAELD